MRLTLDDFQKLLDAQESEHLEFKDDQFVRFLERLAAEKQLSFGLEELLVLADLRDAKSIPPPLQPYLAKLSELGAIEKVARGKYVL
ncbi:MAG: hypothetical protein MUC50_23200 [Myxococcota bacterium]|jgi:hypothetical protein|nr:hypothetical protein [Myxococcota bacterium]